jgi:hypothetical protein
MSDLLGHRRWPDADLVAGRVARACAWVAGGLIVLLLVGLTAFTAVSSAVVHFGLGQRGTFTATSDDCGRNACIPVGTFAPSDGGPVQTGIDLQDGGGASWAAGSQGSALLIAGAAYPPGGGSDWIISSLVVVAEIALIAWGTVSWRRRRQKRRTAAASGP